MFIAFAFPPQSKTENPLDVLSDTSLVESELRYTLLVRDVNLDNPERFTAKPIGNFDNTAIFRLPHRKEHAHYTLAAESVSKMTAAQKFDHKNPQKIGIAFFEKIEPLNPNFKELEISDLVLGGNPPEGFDANLLPFPIVPTRRIWKQDALRVYFEVYHLQLEKDGSGKFTIDSRIIRLKKKGRKFVREEIVATTFEFSSTGTTSREDFGIFIANYKPGSYELEVEVVDRVSGRKKKTSTPFEIVE
jgi:hypothetical protein